MHQRYQIKLSTSKTSNLNFILSNSDQGAILYDRIRSHFISGSDGSMEIDVTGKENYDILFAFIDEPPNYGYLLDLFVDMETTGEFQAISDDANNMYTKFLVEHKTSGCGGVFRA